MLEKLNLANDADCGFCDFTFGWLTGVNFTQGTESEIVAYQAPNLMERIPGLDVSHSGGGVQLWLGDGRIICDAVAVGEILNCTIRWWWLGRLICLPIAENLVQYVDRIVVPIEVGYRCAWV